MRDGAEGKGRSEARHLEKTRARASEGTLTGRPLLLLTTNQGACASAGRDRAVGLPRETTSDRGEGVGAQRAVGIDEGERSQLRQCPKIAPGRRPNCDPDRSAGFEHRPPSARLEEGKGLEVAH